PRQITGPMRALYANAYARPGSMSAAFGYFAAFAADAEDNVRLAEQLLAIPVLGLGGERSVGPLIESIVSELATSAQAHVIASAGHWLMEESPEGTVQAIEEFLTANPAEADRGLQLSIPLRN
ncbi:MAG: alpha/beta hydrolase, partial [Planctomycetota bacterium]